MLGAEVERVGFLAGGGPKVAVMALVSTMELEDEAATLR